MDFFEKIESKKKSEKKSVEAIPRKHHKRYGTKKPVERFDKQDIISKWREDL